MIYSFNSSKSRGVWGGWTLNWYVQMFQDRDILSALTTTVLLALSAAIISTIVGTAAAIGIHFMRRKPRAWVMNLTYIPVVNPDIVMGISLMLLFIFMRIPSGFGTLLLAHVTFCIPYVILSVLPKLSQINPHMFEAAEDLGASTWTTLWKVIIPEIRPGIMAGLLLSVTLSFDDFVVSYFTTGAGVNTLSILIYAMARKGVSPTINALSTVVFAVVMILLLIVNIRGSKEKKVT